MEMGLLFSVLLLIVLVLTVAIYRFSAIIWTTIMGVALLGVSFCGGLPGFLVLLCWILFAVAAGFANLHSLRRRFITGPLLTRIKSQLPVISPTEQEAIKAGNTWWEKELFCGQPDWQQLLKFPAPTLTIEEQSYLDNQVEQLCQMLNDWQITQHDADLSPEAWAFIKKEKFFGLIIPKEYGGLEFSAYAHSCIVTKIASRSVSAATNIMVPNSLGPAEILLRYGTAEQKNHYLPRLAVGQDVPCFALTSPLAGSDASNIPDTGIVCKGIHNGQEVTGIRLTWDKRYITLAPIATVLGLAVHLYDPDHLLGQQEDMGITLCLIPTAHPGVEIGTRHQPLHMAFMNGPTRGKDVFVPLDWIVGGAEKAGCGWSMLMECLSIGRSISLPALATACGQGTYRFTGAYARLRRQFNTPISSFEGIEEALGNIAGLTHTLEAARAMTAGAVDLGINPSTASAIAKYHMTEISRTIVAHAMDVHAGHMVQLGPRNILANAHFSMPISITVEGANILTRNLIIFGQGAIRCHPYILKEIDLMTAPTMDVVALDKVLLSHIGFYTCNLLSSVAYALTGGRFIAAPAKKASVQKLQRQLTRMSTALALAADTCLIVLGGSLKRRERISARLGDVLSQLYLASAALKYYHDHQQTESDLDYLNWSVQHCLAKVQVAFNELFNNLPGWWMGRLLKLCIFPFGQAYYQPADALTKKLVAQMITCTPIRDQLTKFCFISNDPEQTSRRLETALTGIDYYDSLQKKLHEAVKQGRVVKCSSLTDSVNAAEKAGILSSSEAQTMIQFDALITEVIKVNEFTFNLEKVID